MASLLRGRNSNRFSATIWPGFVDAMTALLMVMMFIITIFMIVQFALRDTVDRQGSQLDRLSDQVAGLTNTLSLTRHERDAEALRAVNAEAALTQSQENLNSVREELDITEQARLTEAKTAEKLRTKIRMSEAKLAATERSLEEIRRKAEETLILLAAAEAVKADLEAQHKVSVSKAERQAALLAIAQKKLAGQDRSSQESQRQIISLSAQVAELNVKLASVQKALDIRQSKGTAAELRLDELGAQLNQALLQASQEQQKRLELEEAARQRLEAEATDLARYRSEFFGKLSEVLQGREGVEIVGDRFVFPSEVLFGQGEADLSQAGKDGITRITDLLNEIAKTIPTDIDWVIRVDGHTDSTPLSGYGRYRDNWELSQARALAVVRFMVDDLKFPADRLAPTGFADTRPVASDDTAQERARNRRIELKLTER